MDRLIVTVFFWANTGVFLRFPTIGIVFFYRPIDVIHIESLCDEVVNRNITFYSCATLFIQECALGPLTCDTATFHVVFWLAVALSCSRTDHTPNAF